MNLQDRLHCPACQGRLSVAGNHGFRCSNCSHTVPVLDEIVDFLDGRLPLPSGTDRYRGAVRADGSSASNLLNRIKVAAGGRWPAAMGDVIEFGCGPMTHSIAANEIFRSMIVFDSELSLLQACRADLVADGADRPLSFVALSGGHSVIRDTVADTVVGGALLSGISDVRAFLTMVHRALKPHGRAMFVVPNRRYYQAICQALAEALVQLFARTGAWPQGCGSTMRVLADLRRLLIHRNDEGFLISLTEKHLFDSDALEDLGKEIGFAQAEIIPLDPDPAGAETMARLCQNAGAPDDFARETGALAASTGHPYLSLLSYQDSSALSLLWLTKAFGPEVRVYASRRTAPASGILGLEAAVGGVQPRWSIELLAKDTPDGILVTVGGWCLSNVDVRWVRITLDGVARHTPVWRPRADVHEVLNRGRIFHPMNALCSGIEGDLLFTDVAQRTLNLRDTGWSLGVHVVLASGLVITGPAPERLALDEPVVVVS
jgi:hypothetical protein